MIAIFNFSLESLLYGLEEWQSWTGPCDASFVDTGRDSFPLRGDVEFLNKFAAELSVMPLQDGSLNQTLMTPGLDELIEKSRSQGSRCDADIYVMRYWPQTKGGSEFLALTVALKEPKFTNYQRFMERHIGRADLFGRMVCKFYGFSETDSVMPNLPTRDEFLHGRPYFVSGQHSIVFGNRLP